MIGDLQRFLTAQEGKTIHGNTLYEQALIEIQEGKPDFECWVRYVYPQLKRSGTSKLTDFYGLNSREEAKAYIEHPILGKRLVEICEAILNNEKSVYEIFGDDDTIKVRNCILLFASVSDIPVFKQLKSKYRW